MIPAQASQTLEFKNRPGAIIVVSCKTSPTGWENIMPLYVVRHIGEEREELPCFLQLEDEGAAMYFNIVHGRKVRRRFTTERVGDKCTDYVLVARESGTGGDVREREISLFNLTPHEVRLM
jgi:hypothetical protein